MEELYGRKLPDGQAIGESWELVDRPEAQSVTGEGSECGGGVPLHDLWTGAEKEKIFGKNAPDTERFPILIKILDCKEKLSLQVHPPTEKAKQFNGEPKTELWYFLHTEKAAEIYVGLKKGVTRAEFERAIEEKRVGKCFHRLKTAPRETMFLPSGRVHGIGSGNVILEIQQNSDTTFRVYDWDRIEEKTGKPRQLHVKESLECINFNDCEPNFTQPHGKRVVSTEFFDVNRAVFYEKEARDFEVDENSFQYFFISKGKFKFADREWREGDAVLFSANSGVVEMEALTDFAEIIAVSFPEK